LEVFLYLLKVLVPDAIVNLKKRKTMNFDLDEITKQLEVRFGLDSVTCENLNTLANYAIEVTSSIGHFALKIYNPASRTASEVQWEIDFALHLIKNGDLGY
jgi:Ser/Thr protein kinase RdoA (MazF antagonist)